jgi:integrase
MSRSIHKLSAKQVVNTNKPGRYSDGAGLYLRVSANGQKRWVLRYTPAPGAKPREMGLGSAGSGAVSLAQARTMAQQARTDLTEGADPINQRQQQSKGEEAYVTLFGEFADEFVESQTKNFHNDKHIAQWKMTLSKYAKPLRRKSIDDISTDDILAILKPLWHTKHETANRLRGRRERVLNAAKARGLRSGENPAQWRGHLELLLPKQNKLQRAHFAAMDYKALPAFMQALREREGIAPLALEFLILSAARSGEVRNMEWDDLSFTEKVWTVPAHKMKAAKEHRVPLTSRMLQIIETVRPFTQEQPFVFSTRNGTAMSDAAMSSVLKRMEITNATVHGFRSSFRDWAGDMTDYPREVAEEALAHTVGNATECAYRRSDAFGKRTTLMMDWLSYINGK